MSNDENLTLEIKIAKRNFVISLLWLIVCAVVEFEQILYEFSNQSLITIKSLFAMMVAINVIGFVAMRLQTKKLESSKDSEILDKAKSFSFIALSVIPIIRIVIQLIIG